MSKADVLPDLPARRRALLDHGTTLLVEAGAGSGKTALMAGRVALLLAAGNPTREIVAITFTEAAASELRERIEGFVNRLARADIPDELRAALPAGLSAEQSAAIAAADETLDELTCTTIHGLARMKSNFLSRHSSLWKLPSLFQAMPLASMPRTARFILASRQVV